MAEELSDVELRDRGKEEPVGMPNHSKDLTEVNRPLEVKMLKENATLQNVTRQNGLCLWRIIRWLRGGGFMFWILRVRML